MNKKSFYVKIGIVIALTVLILAGLIYLVLHDHRQNIHPQQSPSASAVVHVSPSPSATPLPSASAVATPEITATPEVSPDVTSDDSMQRIVNHNHRVAADYVPDDLVNVNVRQNEMQQLRKEAAEQLEMMFAAAQDDGISLYLISGYRSYSEQQSLYYTYEELYGRSYADSIDDRPGESEHQLGLAADIGTSDQTCELNACFADTDAFHWLEEHAGEYGYIERYPADKQSITGVAYSPWNYRYIGVAEAQKVKASGLTLEEYYNTF